MGLEPRLGQLIANCESETEAQRLIGEATRLVHPDEMGNVYKVLAITAPVPTAQAATEGVDGSASETAPIVPIGGFE